jgi:hypothetical protein
MYSQDDCRDILPPLDLPEVFMHELSKFFRVDMGVCDAST